MNEKLAEIMDRLQRPLYADAEKRLREQIEGFGIAVPETITVETLQAAVEKVHPGKMIELRSSGPTFRMIETGPQSAYVHRAEWTIEVKLVDKPKPADPSTPLTAEEIAGLRNHLERGSPRDGWGHPVRHGDEQSRLRDLERAARNALPRLLDEVERWRNPEAIRMWRDENAATLERARALLKRIEWSGENDGGRTCPECGMTQPHSGEPQPLDRFIYGHRPDCELAALLGHDAPR